MTDHGSDNSQLVLLVLFKEFLPFAFI